MQFRFMGREQVRKEHGAFHEPAPSPLPSSAGAECGPLGQSVVRKQFQKEQDPTGWPAREDLSSVALRRLEARPTESAISIVHNQLRDLPGLMDTSPAMA